MNKKGNMMAGVMVVLIVMILVVTIISSFITSARDTTTIAEDLFTASNTSCVKVTDNCISSLTSFRNGTGSGTIGVGNFSRCTVTGGAGLQGIILDGLLATESQFNAQTVNASYVEESCTRLTGMTATIIAYLPLLLAVAILVFVAFLIK